MAYSGVDCKVTYGVNGTSNLVLTWYRRLSEGVLDEAVDCAIREELSKAVLADSSFREQISEAIKAATVAMPLDIMTKAVKQAVRDTLEPRRNNDATQTASS
jgi:hypothetical protein